MSSYDEDPGLVDLLEFGFPLDVQGDVPVPTSYRNHKGARDFSNYISTYLDNEVSLHRLAGPFQSNPFSVPIHVSPLNTVPKDGNERRVIADLSWPHGTSINDHISSTEYLGEELLLRYVTIEDICNMVCALGPGSYIYKRDLKKAYRQIPVDPGDYRYLGYYWDSQLYFDTVLVMGQRNAAMACQRTTNGVMFIHQQRGHSGVAYLDDLIGVSPTSTVSDAFDSLGHLLEELGLAENHSKAAPPDTVQMVLGVLIDTVSVDPIRMKEIQELLAVWKQKIKCTKVELQSLLGKLSFVVKCVRQSRVFLNRILSLLRSFDDKDNDIPIDIEFQKDIQWWTEFMDVYNGTSFIPSPVWLAPDVVFTTDSTLQGCGGLTDREYFHSPFPAHIINLGLDINVLEILGVVISVRLWGSSYAGQKILVYCDNQQAVLAMNTGKTKHPFMAKCVRQLWWETAIYDFQLKAVHLPGVENRLADSLSRWDLSSLPIAVFSRD